MQIIDENEGTSQAVLDKSYNDACLANKDRRKAIDCPWVKVGNLYLSVTYTGNESWPPLVKHLIAQGVKKFTVFGGRHGQHEGARVDVKTGKILAAGCFEPELYQQDKNEAGKLRKEYGADKLEDIVVINVGEAPYDQTKALRDKALSELQRGQVAIFAWCYSIFAMLEYEEWVPKLVVHSHAVTNTNKSVSVLVRDSYNWVPRIH